MRRRAEEAHDPNKHWLGEVAPAGVVVTAAALAEHALVPPVQTRVDTEAVASLLSQGNGPALPDPWAFLSRILGWRAADVAGSPGGPLIPDSLRVSLPASETVLEPHMAVQAPNDEGWQLLIRTEASGIKPDERGALPGWEATPHQRFERLLRETGVPTGLLLTDDALRMIHAPKGGETSGWFSVPLRALGSVAGRGMLGGIKLLLNRYRLFGDASSRRLPTLLNASRRSQAAVSTKLARQVLGALHELLRGLHAGAPERIAAFAHSQPEHVYEGLLAVLMRLVFLLYAEDRGLVPSHDDPAARAFYDQGYGVRALHARLLEDEALHPDTMEERQGAWHRLLVLFRLVHAGDGTGWMRGRGGKLFNPAAFPFLQGQADPDDPVQVPPVSDGCVLRVLDGLLVLDGERLSYRALDVEQIGSVYETVMGFRAQPATGPSLALAAGKNNRTPVFVDLGKLAAVPGKDRLRWLKEQTERGKFPAKVEKALAAGQDADALAAALADVVDDRGSPGGRIWPTGTPILQPTDERRRTGSHYTPRDLTAPVVLHALQPAFDRIGPDAKPKAVLALKVCDPAMGSGAFLVEACRQLAARLVEAWRVHPHLRPELPPDEDENLHARRLVAQQCLYGVDRNPMAVDLARLSLWLATLARDHEFTFLDHALRVGDSLVGLTRAQVERLDWRNEAQGTLFSGIVRERLASAAAARASIRSAGDDETLSEQESRLAEVEQHLGELRLAGNAVVAAYYSAIKDKARRAVLAQLHEATANAGRMWPALAAMAASLRDGSHPLQPFHWELEFPEVFGADLASDKERIANPGFDAIVGNPPFAGKNTLLNGHREGYLDWLQALHAGAHGNADLVAHFVRRAFALLRTGGCFGLIATNTVGQGDTRESGLRAVIEAGGSILRAVRRLPWPGEAAVIVSVMHVFKGGPARSPVLDGRQVRRISAYLVEGDLDANPARLAANGGRAFQGCILLGTGFTFDDAAAAKGKPASTESEMRRLIAKDSRNAERIFPYLGGEEMNTDPRHAHRRWCIDFNDFPLRRERMAKRWAAMSEGERIACHRTGLVPEDYPEAVAADWPDLLEIVERLVKPEREKLKNTGIDKRRKTFWWQFASNSSTMRRAIFGLKRVHAITQTSPHLAVSLLPTGLVYDQKLIVVVDSTFSCFGLCQARPHEIWARSMGGTTAADSLVYAPSDLYQPFPFINGLLQELSTAAEVYYDFRATLMERRGEGLTRTYNRFHNMDEHAPDIVRLRELHHAMDQAVLRAYGWDDLAKEAVSEFLVEEIEPDHHYQRRLFWPAPFRDKVLTRLLDLNAERAMEERARGLVPLSAEAEELEAA